MDRFELRRVDFSLSEEQEAVFLTFADFYRKQSTTAVVRAAEPTGHSPDLWRRLVDMGVTSMSLPESVGGDEAGLVDLTLVTEEHGRALAPAPLISHVIATRLLATAGADLLDTAIEGTQPVALALKPLSPGHPQLVPDAAIARHVIALEGTTLAAYSADQPAAHVPNQGSTPLAWWSPEGSSRAVLAEGSAAVSLHRRAVQEWKLLMAAALVGMTEAALHLAVEFAKTRETMGVPIGSLEGVAFPLVDVEIGIASARNLIRRTAWLMDNDPGHRPDLVDMPLPYAARVATHGTTTSAHMQGGLGFTVEADASLYFLRAKGWSALAGDPTLDYRSVGEALAAQLSE